MFRSVLKSIKGFREPRQLGSLGAPGGPGSKTGDESPSRRSSLIQKLHPFSPAAPDIEEMCGVSPGMPLDEIKSRLARIYRRYNRASSSLDSGLREESEQMLNAIVVVREKYFGPI